MSWGLLSTPATVTAVHEDTCGYATGLTALTGSKIIVFGTKAALDIQPHLQPTTCPDMWKDTELSDQLNWYSIVLRPGSTM